MEDGVEISFSECGGGDVENAHTKETPILHKRIHLGILYQFITSSGIASFVSFSKTKMMATYFMVSWMSGQISLAFNVVLGMFKMLIQRKL